MDIFDIRYLLSALIQVIPMVFSLFLIGILAFSKDWHRMARFIKIIGLNLVIVSLSLIINIAVLFNLTEYMNNNSPFVIIAIALSIASILLLLISITLFFMDLDIDIRKIFRKTL